MLSVGQRDVIIEGQETRVPTLFFRIANPGFPCVCKVVFSVSIGVKIILKPAAAREAKIVLTNAGRCFMYEFDWSNARIPALAAVSPKRETGPWMRAALRPW